MLYLYIDKNSVKILHLKKSILGQYETRVQSKTFTNSNLIEGGKITSVDFVASAVKEVTQSLYGSDLKDKETILILPQESYTFLRLSIPSDVAASTISSFIKDKVRTTLEMDLESCSFDYFMEETPNEKYVHFYAVQNEILDKFKESLNLIELKISRIIPESIAYFKLFQKTLRKDKKENILYASYESNQITAILYDSFGPTANQKWTLPLENNKVEKLLKEKAVELEGKGIKLNRLILAGSQSENVRQDTFTKEIGVWTNPLKRIIPEFYQDYLKLLINSSTKPFTVLSYEACLGSFIFSEQNKNFSLLNNSKKIIKKKSLLSRNQITVKRNTHICQFLYCFIYFFHIIIKI